MRVVPRRRGRQGRSRHSFKRRMRNRRKRCATTRMRGLLDGQGFCQANTNDPGRRTPRQSPPPSDSASALAGNARSDAARQAESASLGAPLGRGNPQRVLADDARRLRQREPGRGSVFGQRRRQGAEPLAITALYAAPLSTSAPSSSGTLNSMGWPGAASRTRFIVRSSACLPPSTENIGWRRSMGAGRAWSGLMTSI